ncbi:MAG TPA: nucleoside hydrolase [Pirellulales bacterium]|nr:nucleoside hydrolase [Pirellulales bacterium]
MPLVFETDMGNDIDDALALGVIHALESRGECKLLAVTINKDNAFAAPFVDLVNAFYGRSEIPIGVVRDGKTPEDGRFVRQVCELRDGGRPRYPHKLKSGAEAPEAVDLLRKTLAAQPDGSTTIVSVGFSTNLARLLDSPGDEYSPLAGEQLVAQKCRLLSAMAGNFGDKKGQKEYNIFIDRPAAAKVFERWPTPIVASGFEVGEAVTYPFESIERDFAYVEHHPLSEAYRLYVEGAHDRATWDLTSVLYAVRPDRGYFGLSAPGTIRVDDNSLTHFAPDAAGRHRYLTLDAEQRMRVREALVQLASQPPPTRSDESR